MMLVRFSYSGALESPIDRRAKIERFEAALLRQPQRECPVRDECLAWALGPDNPTEGYGMAGGLTPFERHALRKGIAS